MAPILGVTLDQEWQPVGVVVDVAIEVVLRQDQEGLKLRFHSSPGRFSPLAQQAVTYAIYVPAETAGISMDSWTVNLTFPYAGMTLYGDSLSAMVGLSVVALAKDDPLPLDRSITGTITPNGQIGVVGGVPHKIHAAYRHHLRRVFIPEEKDIADDDWITPFLMHISPVGSVSQAYFGLTDHPL